MRDLEFLPRWYTQLQRQRRRIALQVWIAAALAMGLGLWLALAMRNEQVAQAALQSLNADLQRAGTDVREVERLEVLSRLSIQKADVLSRLGTHVESARLIGKIAEVLPENIALLSLQFETEEIPLPLSGAARAALKESASPAVDRRLRVRLQGVAPTDVEWATCLTELNKIPFVEQVSPTYSHELPAKGHTLRQFEVTFVINLNMNVGS